MNEQEDFNERIAEQVAVVLGELAENLEEWPSEADIKVLAEALSDAAAIGTRVTWATVLTGATAAGIDLPPIFGLRGPDE